jgi:Reverse transcriptase (RNA-dependent DNA polymerase)
MGNNGKIGPEKTRETRLLLPNSMSSDCTIRWMAWWLNSCQTDDIVSMCEKYNILPANHFGARPGHTTTDSIHMLMKTVKDTWHKGQVASTLFPDIKGAFPSVDINRLIHNMREREIPWEYTKWMERRLGNQWTTLSFDDYQMAMFIVANSLDQGDPFSGICYLVYYGDLTKIPIPRLGEWVLLFVDDLAIIVSRRDFVKTHATLWTTEEASLNGPKNITVNSVLKSSSYSTSQGDLPQTL